MYNIMNKYFVIQIGEGEYDAYETRPMQVWDVTNSFLSIEALSTTRLTEITFEFCRETNNRRYKHIDTIITNPEFKDWMLKKYNIVVSDEVYHTTI